MKVHVFRNSFYYGISSILSKLFVFLLIPIYTRIFSVADYGVIGLMASLMGVLAIFMQLGSNNALQRFYFEEDNTQHRSKILSSGLLIVFFSSTLLVFILVIAGEFFGGLLDRLGIPVGVFLIALLSLYLNQYILYIKEVMRVLFSPLRYFIYDFIPVVLGAVASVALLLFVERSLDMFYLGLVIGAIVGFLLAIPSLRDMTSVVYDRHIVKDMVTFGYPFVFVGLAYWIFQSADRIMLGELSTLDEVGLYHISVQFSIILYVVISAFGASWGPFAMKLLSENENHKKIFSQFATLWMLLLSFGTIVLTLFIEDLLTLMTRQEYYLAKDITPILLFGVFMSGTTQFSVLGISIVKKTTLISKYAWIIALINVFLNLLLIPWLGAKGAALATTMSSTVLTCLYLIRSQREYYIAYDYLPIISLCALTLLTTLVVSTFTLSLYIKIVSVVLLSVLFVFWGSKKYKSLERLL